MVGDVVKIEAWGATEEVKTYRDKYGELTRVNIKTTNDVNGKRTTRIYTICPDGRNFVREVSVENGIVSKQNKKFSTPVGRRDGHRLVNGKNVRIKPAILGNSGLVSELKTNEFTRQYSRDGVTFTKHVSTYSDGNCEEFVSTMDSVGNVSILLCKNGVSELHRIPAPLKRRLRGRVADMSPGFA